MDDRAEKMAWENIERTNQTYIHSTNKFQMLTCYLTSVLLQMQPLYNYIGVLWGYSYLNVEGKAYCKFWTQNVDLVAIYLAKLYL